MPKTKRILGLAALCTVAAGVWLYALISRDFIDLEVYRLGVEAWRGGGDMYGPLPPTSVGIGLPFIYPPFAALALSPFALLPWDTAAVALFGCSLAALAVTLFLVARRLWPAEQGRTHALLAGAVAVPLALFCEPMFETLNFGQVNLLLMALVAADCLARKPRWPRGLLIGLAAAIKLTPAAFVLFFLIRKDYRAAVTAAVAGTVATLVGFAVAGEESMDYWFGGLAGAARLSGSPYRTNQSFQGVLARLEVPEPAFTVLWLVLSLAVFGLAAVAMWRAAGMPAIALSINAVAALLASPISWSHHWVWVAPALLAMCGYALRLRHTDRDRSARWWVAAAVTGVVVVVGPHRHLPGADFRELDWTVWQHLVGNTYVWLSVLLVVLFLLVPVPPDAGPAGDGAEPGSGDPDAAGQDPGGGAQPEGGERERDRAEQDVHA